MNNIEVKIVIKKKKQKYSYHLIFQELIRLCKIICFYKSNTYLGI